MPLKCEKCGGTHLSNWPCIRRKPDWFDERKEANAIAAKSKFDDIYNAAIAAFKRQRAALTSSHDSRSTPTEEKQNPSVAPLVEALTEISKGAGAFDLDPLQHATNCITEMKAIAIDALAQAGQEPPKEQSDFIPIWRD